MSAMRFASNPAEACSRVVIRTTLPSEKTQEHRCGTRRSAAKTAEATRKSISHRQCLGSATRAARSSFLGAERQQEDTTEMPSKGSSRATPAVAAAQGEDLGEIGGLSLDSSPVKPSSSAQTRSSSSEPSSGSNGNGLPMFIQQEDMEDLDDDDDEEGGKKGKKGGIPNPGRRKIEIEYIEDKASSSVACVTSMI